MRMKFTFKPQTFLAAAALFAGLLVTTISRSQALFKGGMTYYVNGSGVDLVAPKDTFVSLQGVGVVYTGGAYTDNTGILPALSVNGIDSLTLGQITILLVPGYNGSESLFPTIRAVPYASPLRPIVMKPAAGSNFNISRTTFGGNEAVLRMEGAQFFTIDGEGTPGQRNLTFTATNGTQSNHRVIDIVSNLQVAVNTVAVKNCNLTGIRPGANSFTTAGVYVGGTSGPSQATPRRNENVSVINCDMQNVQQGVYARGVNGTAGQQDRGLVVRDNIIGGAPGSLIGSTISGQGGIVLLNQANAIIEKNTIRDCDPSASGYSGILVSQITGSASLDSNIYINANKIYNLNVTVNNSAVYGIRFTHSTSRTTNMSYVITNNVISNISSRPFGAFTANTFPMGICIDENSSNASVRIFNNSISMTGATLFSNGTNQMAAAACVFISNNTTGGIQLMNNILSNRMSNLPGNNTPYQVFGVYVNNTSEPFDSIDNNIYDISTAGGWAMVGRNLTPANTVNHYASLGEWREFTGDDENSTNIRPVFSDPLTLATADGAPAAYGNMGKVLVSSDVLGIARPMTAQSIGAYQFTGDAANANAPLTTGTTYPVNGVNVFPTMSSPSGSFRNLADFADYLNSYGVGGGEDTVHIVISAGYTGDTTVIPAINAYPGMAGTRKISLRTAPGITALITLPEGSIISGNSALFRLNGVSDFTIDGRDPNNPALRTLTFALPNSANITTSKVISLTATPTRAVSRNTVVNCNFLGSSTSSPAAISTFAGIYLGDPFSLTTGWGSSVGGPNVNVILTNNFIGGVRNGIYNRAKPATGPNGAPDQTYTITRNVIGGYVEGNRTNQIGGAADQAGIYIKGIWGANIDSNIIRNSLSSLSTGNGFRGIDLDGTAENGKSQNLNVTRNTIYNLGVGTAVPAGGYAVGIKVALNEPNRNTLIANNFISKIYGTGGAVAGTVNSPTGIGIDQVSGYMDLGITVAFNTVSLSQVPQSIVTGVNPSAYSTGMFIGTNVGGISLVKNIFNNTYGRSQVGSISNTVAIAFSSAASAAGSPTTAFTIAQGNVYHVKGTNSYNYVGVVGGLSSVNQLYSVAEVKNFTGDVLASFGEVPFLNDTTIDMDLRFIGHIINARNIAPSNGVAFDITGKPRNFKTSVGAIEITPVYIPLQGGATYEVDGTTLAPPTAGVLEGKFNTINNLFRYINTNGVDDDQAPPMPITIEIKNTYNGEGDTLISPLHEFPLMSFNRNIIIKPAAGANPVIATTANNISYENTTSVIKFQGAQYVTIDGSNDGSPSRNLTIRMPIRTANNHARINNANSRVIDVMGWSQPALGIQIKNCNLIGYSDSTTIYSYAGIYQGGVNFYASPTVPFNPIRTKNNNNVYTNNYIVAAKYGVQLRGNVGVSFIGGQDYNNSVIGNTIGGTVAPGTSQPTDFFGGINNAAGISASAQARLLIDSNLIRNNIRTFNANSGIELTNPASANITNGTDSAVTVSRNIIQNIRTNGQSAYGIFTNMLQWMPKRSINLVNNMISGISSAGTSPTTNIANNPYGIFLNGAPSNPANTDFDINIYHNSINLGGNGAPAGDTLGTSGISACIGIGGTGTTPLRGEIRLENNILQNRLTRVAAGGPIYAIYAQSPTNPFLVSDNNNYFVGGANSVNHLAGLTGTGTVTLYSNLASWAAFTQQDTMSINYPAPFTSNLDLLIPSGTISPLYHGGRRILNVTNDVLGNPRPLQAFGYATIGAHEFTGSYADSSAPKMYDMTTVPLYCEDYSGGMTITARVMDRNASINDTMYYSINGGPEAFVLATAPVNGFDRTYHIPDPMGPDVFVSYRFSSVDGSGKSGTFVNADPVSGMGHKSTMVSTLPMTNGFDLPNKYGFKTQQVQGTAGWNLHSFGSLSNPFLFPATGARAALMPASNGSVSRIVTPCIDFVGKTLPILRLFVSQNYDFPAQNDSIVVKTGAGFNQWIAIQGGSISRVSNITTPGYKVYDVCLTALSGQSGLFLGIEGYSKGGSNLLIDSIVLFDNFVDHDIAPATQQSCFNDSFHVDVLNSSNQNSYYLFDEILQKPVGPQVIGNGGTLKLAGYLSTADSAHIKVRYINLTSGCEVNPADLTKMSVVYFGTFKNGPFVKEGPQFYGKFNDGTALNPDAVRIGGSADFEIVTPGGKQNSDYGVTWTVAAVDFRNLANNVQNNSVVSIIPATPSTPAYIRVNGVPADSNKLFRLGIVLRLLPDGCDSVVTRLVRVAHAPVANYYAFNDTLCQGQNVQFNNVTANGVFTLPVNYEWDFGDNTTSNAISPTKRFTVPGIYKVTLRARNSSTLVDSLSFDFVVNPAPTASYTSTLACAGKDITFTNTSTNTPDITYAWNIAGQISTNRDVVTSIPLSDTTVNVRLIVTNDLGCSDTARVATTVFAQPVAAFNATSVCAGAPVQFNNTSTIAPGKNGRINTFGSEWSFGNGDIGYANSPLYQYPAGGNYIAKLKVISNFGCTDTVSAPVSVFDKPVAVFTVDNTCKSTDLVIANNSTFSQGLDKVKYSWNFGDNSPSSDLAVPVKQYGEARSFFISLTVTDTINNCKDSVTKLITIKESATADFTAGNGCVNTPVAFTNVSIVPPLVTPVFAWEFGDGNVSSDPSPNHAYTTGGDKNVKFTVDVSGCKSVVTKTISISSVQPVTFTKAALDADSTTYQFTASPGTSVFRTFTWNFGDNNPAVTRNTETITNIFTKAGVYTVTLVATDANGCSSTFSLNDVEVKTTVGVKEDMLAAKFNFNLYPNPFSASAQVTFDMDAKKQVTVDVYDMLGRKVFTRDAGMLSAGKQSIEFNETEFSAYSAAYLVKVQIGGEVITRQLIKK